MLERMEDVNMKWGLNTVMKKRLNFFDNELYIAKMESEEDGTITWDVRLSSGTRIADEGTIITYKKEEDTREKEEESLELLINRLNELLDMDITKTVK